MYARCFRRLQSVDRRIYLPEKNMRSTSNMRQKIDQAPPHELGAPRCTERKGRSSFQRGPRRTPAAGAAILHPGARRRDWRRDAPFPVLRKLERQELFQNFTRSKSHGGFALGEGRSRATTSMLFSVRPKSRFRAFSVRPRIGRPLTSLERKLSIKQRSSSVLRRMDTIVRDRTAIRSRNEPFVTLRNVFLRILGARPRKTGARS